LLNQHLRLLAQFLVGALELLEQLAVVLAQVAPFDGAGDDGVKTPISSRA
jgi:hypothetical protein